MSGTVYRVVLERPVQKMMERLPRDVRRRLSEAMMALGDDPRPNGYAQLKGEYKNFRIRVGGWRIIYTILDDKLVVLILEVGTRGGIYRKR